MPIGTVITWPLLTDPGDIDAGKWLECNGQYVNPTLYPKLATLMSHTPDYRGLFLRGYGSVTHIQNNGDTVGITATIHATDALGMIQGDAIRNITGSFGQHANVGANGVFYRSNTAREGVHAADRTNNSVNFDASLVVPIANENRPINTAVRYLICAK